MTALPLGLRSRNAISRQIGKSANAIPVMAVTGKNESKPRATWFGAVRASFGSDELQDEHPKASAEPERARRPAASRLNAHSMEQDPFAAMPSISCIISAHVSIRHSGGPGPTDGRDEDPGLLLVTQIGGASSFFIVLECREGRPWCVSWGLGIPRTRTTSGTRRSPFRRSRPQSQMRPIQR